MLDRRATRIVWAFLIGVTALEGGALFASFRGRGLEGALRYAFAKPATAEAWAAAAVLMVLYAGYSASASPIIRRHMVSPSRWSGFAAVRLFAIPMALVSGFFEEAFFRKMLMDVAMNHGATVSAQIALSAVAFGAVHAVWGVIGGNLRGALGAMLATGVLGAALAAVYLLGGRSIGPCIAAHAAINLLLEPWLIIAAATNGWQARPTPRSAAV